MQHTPVLVEEILRFFNPQPGNRFLDATLGLGGHSRVFLSAAHDTTVVGLEADEKALAQAKENLQEFGGRVTYIHTNFATMKDSLLGGGIVPPLFSHILFDLGVGSHQLSDTERSFSFTSPAALTMRFGDGGELPPSQLQPVQYLTHRLGFVPDVPDLIAGLTEKELADLIFHFGQERYSRRIARAIKQPPGPQSGHELAQRVVEAVPKTYEHGRIHPATRTFQALRLTVNRELEALEVALPQARDLLIPGGTLAVMSFHSLEDRIVKYFFRHERDTLTTLTKKPVVASQAEKQRNPRARSAKLRVARRL